VVADTEGEMSTPPPSSAPPSAGTREHVIAFEAGRGWGRRRAGEDCLRLTPAGAVVEHERLLRAPLSLPLGQLQLGLVDPGPARPGGESGRFPVLRRLPGGRVIPSEHGIEGWLWTTSAGSGLTVLGDADDAPNAALLLTKPLGEEAIAVAFAPEAAEDIAARSPLGAPAVHGLLFRVRDTLLAEQTFRRYGLLRPLTDREVPPTLRRSLPSDRPADPRVVSSEDARVATSVAPPGMG
jgi:hypothetical protein